MTLAAPRIENGLTRGGEAGNGLGQWCVVAGVEKAPTVPEHLDAVAGFSLASLVGNQQVDVTLAGDVEGVARGAAPRLGSFRRPEIE
jgi:hypothetical protein